MTRNRGVYPIKPENSPEKRAKVRHIRRKIGKIYRIFVFMVSLAGFTALEKILLIVFLKTDRIDLIGKLGSVLAGLEGFFHGRNVVF